MNSQYLYNRDKKPMTGLQYRRRLYNRWGTYSLIAGWAFLMAGILLPQPYSMVTFFLALPLFSLGLVLHFLEIHLSSSEHRLERARWEEEWPAIKRGDMDELQKIRDKYKDLVI